MRVCVCVLCLSPVLVALVVVASSQQQEDRFGGLSGLTEGRKERLTKESRPLLTAEERKKGRKKRKKERNGMGMEWVGMDGWESGSCVVILDAFFFLSESPDTHTHTPA